MIQIFDRSATRLIRMDNLFPNCISAWNDLAKDVSAEANILDTFKITLHAIATATKLIKESC